MDSRKEKRTVQRSIEVVFEREKGTLVVRDEDDEFDTTLSRATTFLRTPEYRYDNNFYEVVHSQSQSLDPAVDPRREASKLEPQRCRRHSALPLIL